MFLHVVWVSLHLSIDNNVCQDLYISIFQCLPFLTKFHQFFSHNRPIQVSIHILQWAMNLLMSYLRKKLNFIYIFFGTAKTTVFWFLKIYSYISGNLCRFCRINAFIAIWIRLQSSYFVTNRELNLRVVFCRRCWRKIFRFQRCFVLISLSFKSG